MLISPQHKFIFFKPMKYAGSSVEAALLERTGVDAFCSGGYANPGMIEYNQKNNKFWEAGQEKHRFHQHTWPELFFSRIALSERWEGYKKITMVRNPWDAVVSYYWWSVSDLSSHLQIQENEDMTTARFKFDMVMNSASRYEGDVLAQEMGVDNDVISPLAFLANLNNRFITPRIDTYIKFEALQHDYAVVCEELGISAVSLPHFKSTQRQLKHHYSYYYTDFTREAIYALFQDTIEQFDYTFDENF